VKDLGYNFKDEWLRLEADQTERDEVNMQPRMLNLNELLKGGGGPEVLKALDKYDEEVREYYLKLENPALLEVEKQLIDLLQLIKAILEDIPEFPSKFVRPSLQQKLLLLAATDCLKRIRIARKLLLEGYIPEMYEILRMVVEWCKSVVVIEALPATAEQILEKGINSKIEKKAKDSSIEVSRLLDQIDDNSSRLSPILHVTAKKIRLTKREQGDVIEIFASGWVDQNTFNKSADDLSKMTQNVIGVLKRHFL